MNGYRKIRARMHWLLVLPFVLMMSFAPVNNKAVKDFRLLNVNGEMVSMKEHKDAKGFIIVFTCNHCPFAKLYYERLNELNTKYKALGVPVLAISSTDTLNYEEDAYDKMVEKAKEAHFNFPYLYDNTQQVAKGFAAQKTPHAYVVWKEKGQWLVKYNGAIDDNGAHPELVKNHYLAQAVDELLASKEVTTKETKSIGCQINFR